MWTDDYDFPSVEDRAEDFLLPDDVEDWNEWWRSRTTEKGPAIECDKRDAA